MYYRRILPTIAATALTVLAACSDSTAPKRDCSAEMAATGKAGVTSGTHGTNPDGSEWETWFYSGGTSITFTWGGPLASCQVTHASQ